MPPASPYKIRPSPSRARPSPARTKRRISDDGKEGTVVAIRMRPLNNNEGGKKRVWQVMPKNNAVQQTSRDGKPLDRIAGRTYFNYDKTFGEEVNTVEVYNDVAKPIVTSVVNGLNGTIFAYGQTSSGKTYTMQGSGSIEDGSHSEGGIVHMAVRDIFSHIESQKDRMFLVRASFLEIYNEDVRDLLSNSTASLQIREDPRHGVFVQSVEETVTDFESLLQILFHGEKSRQVASTGMNERSSRSHTIFRITIESREIVEGSDGSEKENDSSQNDGAVLVSTLNLVDLAGSESVRHTGASGDRQKEGGMINQSLLTLSRVIQALGTNQGHINFRDSKLTRLLQSSLSGNAKMAVVCCATPSELYLEETRSTLQFASRASLVKTNAQVNEVLDDRSMIKRLQRELAEAKKNSSAPGPDEIQAMEDKAAVETKARLARLTSCLLNGGHLFASIENNKNSMVLSPSVLRMKQRKRRQSEGNFFTGIIKSPLKLNQQMNIAPLTEPRRKKTKQFQQQISPKSQISIVREALSSRSNFARSLQDTVSNMKFVIQSAESRFKEEKESNDSKMIEFQGRYEALQQDHDQSQIEKAAARDKNARLMDETAKVHEDYEDMKKQNADLQQHLGQLLSDFDVQRQQNEAKINELETLRVEISEVERLLREEEEKAHEKDEQLSKFEVEQESMKEQLERQKAEFTAWSEAQTVKTQSLQEEISSLQQDGEIKIDGLNKQLVESISSLQEATKDKAQLETRLSEAAEENIGFQRQQELLEEKITELNLTVEHQHKEIENLSAQKIEVEGKLETAETSLEDVEDELEISRADMSSRIECLEGKVQQSATENTQVKQELEEVIVAKNLMEQKIVELEANVEEEHAQIQKLDKEKSDLETKLETVESSLEDTEEELEIARSDMSSRIESLEEKLQAAEAETVHVKKEFDEINTKKDELEGKLESCRSELESLSTEKSALDNKLTKASGENDDLQNKNDELEITRSDMSSRIESLEEKLQAAEAETVHVKKEFDEMNTKKDELEGKLESCRSELEALSTAKSEVDNKLTNASEENADLQNKNEELEITRSDMSSRIESLEEKLQAAEAETVQVKKEFDEMNTKKVEVEGKLESCRSELESLSTEKSALENTLVDSSVEKTELDNKHQQLKEKITELTASMQEQHEHIERLHAEKSNLETKFETTKASLEDSEGRMEIERADMNSQIAGLEEQLKAANSETAKVKQEMEETCSKNDSLSKEAEEKLELVSKQKEEVEAKLADSRDEKAELESQHQLVEEKITELTFSVEQHQMEIEKLHSDKKNLESILDEAEKSLEDSEEQLEKTKSDMGKSLEVLEEKLQVAEAETAEVTKMFEESTKEKDAMYNDLEENLRSMSVEKTELEEKLVEMADEKTDLQDQHLQLEEKIATLTSAMELRQSDVEMVKSEKCDLEAKLKTKEASLQQSEEQLEITRADMSNKVDCLNKRLLETKADLAQVQKELEDTTTTYNTSHHELDGKLGSMAEAKEQLEADISKANSEKETLQIEQAHLEERISKLECSLEEQKVEIDELNAAKSDMESKLAKSESKVQESQENLASLDANLRSVQEQKSLIEEKLNSELREKEVWKMDAEKKNGDLDEELHSLRNELVTLRGHLQNAEQWKQSAVSEQEKYQETINDLKSLLEELKNDSTSLSKEHDEVCQMLEKAKDDGCALMEENLEVWSNVSDLGEKLLSLGKLLAEREEEAEVTRTHWYKALHENGGAKMMIRISEEEIRSGRSSLIDAKNELDDAFAKIQSIESSQEKNILENLEKEEQILQLQQGMDTANSKNLAIAAELNSVVQNLNEQKALNQGLETTRKELESKVASISLELEKLTTEKINMQADTSDAEGTIFELQRKLAQAESTSLHIRNSNQVIIAEQEEAYRELESRLKELFRGLESLKDEKGDLEDQIMQLENEKRELQTTCDALSKEKDEIDGLLEQATQDLSANEETISQATETIDDLQHRLKLSEEQLKKIAADHESKISSLQERLTSSLKEIDMLKSTKFDLETRIEELESGLDCQLQTLQEELLEAQSANERLKTQAETVDVTAAQNRSEVMEIKTMTTAILAEKDAVEALLSESQLQAHQLEEQLDNARAEYEQVLTNTALQLNQQQKRLEAMTLAKNEAESNLNKRLKDRELERDEATAELQKLYTKNKELSQSIATCVTKERESELASQISNLKQENVELKQLLISANESEERGRKEIEKLEMECDSKSRELDDASYRLSQMEDELRMAQIPDEQEIDRSHEGLLVEIQEQKAELEKILNQERMERQKEEEDLKRRMGEEQRLLIHEAEEKFSELRNIASEFEARLEQSESDGYQARQEAEELRDQNKEIEDKCIALESAVSDLKLFVTDQENKMSALQSDLQKAKAESYALKETVIEMKERARKASRESEKASRENQISSSEVLALERKISSLEHDAAQQQEQYEHLQSELLTARTEAADTDELRQNAIKSKDEHIERVEARLIQLEGESKRLGVELRMARVQSATQNAAAGDGELHQKIEQLTVQIKKKDSRIKKLEQVRLTKDQVESIKKMKTDSIRLEEECKLLTRKNSELLGQLESSASQPSSVEMDELHSDKKALEKKLMKYVSHCQTLMDDQASMVDAIRSCNIHIEIDSDPNDAVIALCDKYREAKRSQNISNENAMSEQLEKKIKVLVAQIKEMEDSEKEYSARSTQYQKEIDVLKGALSNAKDDVEETKSTLRREISTLKEEALQAIHEKKAAKKKLQRVQSELEMMRMNASMDNPTMDFTVSDMQFVDNSDDAPRKHTAKERTSARTTAPASTSIPNEKSRPPLGDATNATLKQSGVTKSNNNKNSNLQIEKSVLNSASKPGLAPGFGEAAALYDDENTQECKQS